MARMVAAKWAAPPSGRSSRLTEVSTAKRRPSAATRWAVSSGSRGSRASGRPLRMAQKPQARVQVSPMSRKVAVPWLKQWARLGQRASSHTVCSAESRIPAFMACRSPRRTLSWVIQSGRRGWPSRTSRPARWLKRGMVDSWSQDNR